MKTHRKTAKQIQVIATKRRKRVAILNSQGKSHRQIARHLGVHEATVRRDLKLLQLAAEQGAGSGDAVTEKALCTELTEEDQGQVQNHANAVVEQEQTARETEQRFVLKDAFIIPSNKLADAMLGWSSKKVPTALDQFRIFKKVEPLRLRANGPDVVTSGDPESVFQSIERGRSVPSQESETLNFYAGVLADALAVLAPDVKTRYWAIQKAIAELVLSFYDLEVVQA